MAAEETTKVPGKKTDSADGWRRMEIVEASDDESDDALVSIPSKSAISNSSELAAGFRRMNVEGSNDEDEPVKGTRNSTAPLHPDIDIECSRQGLEKAKDKANALFAQGSLEESVRWFSKCIWLIESKCVVDVPVDLHSVLHSNRAFAFVKLKKWAEVTQDCSAALELNFKNTKAKFRRAIAHHELGDDEAALEDIEHVLKEMTDPRSSKEPAELKQKITERLTKARMEAEASMAKCSEKVSSDDQRRMDESDEELYPTISIECNKKGIEKGKEKANSLFALGSLDESVKWFSKCIWLLKSKRVVDVPADLFSVLYSNRAFAYLKLKQYADVEKDCDAALALNENNTKAIFRRSVARFELGQDEDALQDVERVLAELPDPRSNKEAVELKGRITERLKQKALKPSGKSDVQAHEGTSSGGWRRMEIVEESDDESDGGQLADTQTKKEGDASCSASADLDVYPDIPVECSRDGIERAKDEADRLLSQGNLDESVRWFTKCIWLLESKRVVDVPADLHSVLHSNRAAANVKLKKWVEVEKDCNTALALNTENTQANFSRAMAYFETSHDEAALQDIEQVLKDATDLRSSEEASELKYMITQRLTHSPRKSWSSTQAHSCETELHPDIAIDLSRQGIEAGKNRANTFFAQGSFDECVRWLSKCIWLVDSKRLVDVPDDLHSVLYSNRAFAFLKLSRWVDVEQDCNVALGLNSKNTKAKFRRALAHFELSHDEAALRDIEQVLAELPDPKSNKEATDLKDMIMKRLADASTAVEPPEAQIPEDDSSHNVLEAEMHPDIRLECSTKGVIAGKDKANGLFAQGSMKESVRWFSKCIWLLDSKRVVDAPADLHSVLYSNRAFAYSKLKKWAQVEEDCNAALALNDANVKARFRRAMACYELGKDEAALSDIEQALKELPDPASNVEAVQLKEKVTKRLKQKTASVPTDDVLELHPDIEIERSRHGIEKGKDKGNSLFAQGSVAEAVRCFSKCLWLVDGGHVADVPRDLVSILHSNRAFAYVKLQRWAEAEDDCTVALDLNDQSTKARFRRALARTELGRHEAALEDCERVIRDMPDSPGLARRDAIDLRNTIRERLGWKSVPVVEVCEEEEEDAIGAVSAAPSGCAATIVQEAAQPTATATTAATTSRGSPGPRVADATSAKTSGAEGYPAAAAPWAAAKAAASKLAMEASRRDAIDEDSEELYPDIALEFSRQGVEKGKDRGNKLFAEGSSEESVRWFSKSIWLVDSGRAADVSDEFRSILHANRAFALIRLERWQEAEQDSSKSLFFNPNNTKARYRRAVALAELGRDKEALGDVEQVIEVLPDSASAAEATELRTRLLERLPVVASTAEPVAPTPVAPSLSARTLAAPTPAAPTPAAPTPAAPTPAAAPTPSSASRAGGSRAGRAVPMRSVVPSLPVSGPKNSFELLRHFNSMKRHPSVLAEYVRERVPPAVLRTLFSRSPMEPDEMGVLLLALRTSVEEQPQTFGPPQVAEYLRQLLRTHNADTQLAMLSDAEKQVLTVLLETLPASEARIRASILGMI
eukprot:TRINITY_DN10015_c0_g1_i12.p1 TRINITY_DN10015_c0_g1~~TRINITY_DN10015_c0_g1_i12.p1  ORF type:complete len:1536 (+),score=338.32 TRINITY_DN10015_c0_g1_i12:699-5306(+)